MGAHLPRARYVIPGEEWQFWKYEMESGREEYGCIADSVVPVVEAGQAVFVSTTTRWTSSCASSPRAATRRGTSACG